MFANRKEIIDILRQLQDEIFPKIKKCYKFHPWPIIQIQVGYFFCMLLNGKYKEDDYINYQRAYFNYKFKISNFYRLLRKWIGVQLLKRKWNSHLKNKTLIVTRESSHIVNGENIYTTPFKRLLDSVGKENEILLTDNYCTVEECKLRHLYDKLCDYNNLLFNIKTSLFKCNLNNVYRNSCLVEKFFEMRYNSYAKISAHLVYWTIIDNQIRYKTYKDLLKIIKPHLIWVYNYYDNINLSLIRAANAKRIKIVEYQHSTFDDNHVAYTKWNNIDEYSENFPGIFWVWNDISKKIICNNFRGKKYTPQCLIGGNIYLKEQREKLKSKKIVREDNKVLVCLQGRWIPEFVEKFILNDNEYSWYLRLHPRYPEDKHKMENLKDKVPQRIEIKLANSLTLYELFLIVKYNVTSFSTTAYEASEFGVRNIIFSEDGYMKYEQEIKSGLYKYVSSTQELKTVIESSWDIASSSTTQIDEKDIINNLYKI